VYGLMERGELEAGKGHDALVYVTEQALRTLEADRATRSKSLEGTQRDREFIA
jgi:hypothetical protein